MTFDLYYWPSIQGRGEFPRLVLEAGEADYRDVARLPESEGGGIAAMQRVLDRREGRIPFAPPFLVDGEILVSQAGIIAAYLGEALGLAPTGEADRPFARSIALTTADLVAEAHDVHHPVGVGLYYEDQREEAARRAKEFRSGRMPKYLGWYERLLAGNPSGSGWLVGETLTYVDLGAFQVVEGLRYAFPKRMNAIERDYPKTIALAANVARHPPVAAYLASPRRLPFNTDGIFRHYPELDAA